MAGWKWQRPGWSGAGAERDKNQQQQTGDEVQQAKRPPPERQDPRTGWHYMTAAGQVMGPFATAKEGQEHAFSTRQTGYTLCAPKPPVAEAAPAVEPESEAAPTPEPASAAVVQVLPAGAVEPVEVGDGGQ